MIKDIDFLSPPITLFHLEKRTHTSKLGACFVIALVIACSSYTIFLIYNLISHKKMTYIFFKKFEFEAGYYSFDPSSVFHFIQIFAPQSGGYFDKFDSRYIRAYTTYAQSNLSYSNLDLYDHWVFDTCRKNIDDKDLDDSLFQNVENFTNGVCIRHYYNSSERKYYSLEDKGFKWPHLEHGISQRNNIYLTTIVQKCSNDSIINELFGMCPSQKEIDDYVSRYLGIYLYFTDTQVDPTNFQSPVTQYLQVVSTGIGTSETYVESYMHFSPLRVRTKIGSIFGKTQDINSFYFDFNRKGAANNAGAKYFTITRYYHLMQNNVQIYERRYNNLFDLFSEIGGIAQFIFYLFYWVNYIYNTFVIDFDTNSLFFTLNDTKPKTIGNNSINVNSISNKIKINGNDNKIYNIQNNILKLSRRGTKKVRNSKFYVNKNSRDINNFSDYESNLNLEKSSVKQKIKYFEIDNMNQKTIVRRKKLLGTNIINDDNSAQILNELKLGKNYDLIDNVDNINSNRKKNRITVINNSLNQKLSSNSFGKLKKDNDEKEIDNKLICNRDDKNKKESFRPNINLLSSISISKNSIYKINYHSDSIMKKNEEINGAKTFSILAYTKSLIFRKSKRKYEYLTLFRMHLLSEEHLLKSHIKMVLFEKKYNLNNNETTNVSECYNEL